MVRTRALPCVVLCLSLAACSGEAMTPLPAGYPLNPCPLAGANAVTPRAGYMLVSPGQVVFAYEAWHNETPDTFACGAQSVKGGKAIISSDEIPSGLVPWVATYRRVIPLRDPEAEPPTMRLSRVETTGPMLVQSFRVPTSQPQYGTMGNAFEGMTDPSPGFGLYRLDIVSANGELLATGQFQFVN